MKEKIKNMFQKIGIKISKFYPERQAIIEAKKHFGNKEIVACEIGTFKGEHASQMLRNLNIKKLYLIDPYEKYLDYKKDNSCKYVTKAKKEAHNLLKKYRNKIVWIEKFSNEAIKEIKEKIDFLYIDGNHYFPYVDNDIKNYYPLVDKEGIISGHDYANCWQDVVDAVNKFFTQKNKKIIFGEGTDWVVFK